MGSAAASDLARISFADVLDESTGRGYQRPLNVRHSLDFRRYLLEGGAATSTLTLNLRPRADNAWRLEELEGGLSTLIVEGPDPVLAQVDGQHRLAHIGDLQASLSFVIFVGLDLREEMDLFSTINGKAKGLSPSLLDFHAAQLAEDLAKELPELFMALDLNSHPDSVWRRKLRLGGQATLGLKRVASLRMIQQACAEFLKATGAIERYGPDGAAALVRDFWSAVASILPDAWADPRRHVLTKGVGVYALMRICADIVAERLAAGDVCDQRVFAAALADFVDEVDWSTSGQLQGFGGRGGVKLAANLLRAVRTRARIRIAHG
jgi:DGQHR domain-containing protein